MEARRYKLGLGDGSYGPGDIGALTVVEEGLIKGPDLPNWQPEGLLVTCLDPNTYHEDKLRYLVLSPRYATDSLASIRLSGGVVGVARFLPGSYTERPKRFGPGHVEYWAIGVLSPL
jgi:hypothetical protein